jgi:hypothetical protein
MLTCRSCVARLLLLAAAFLMAAQPYAIALSRTLRAAEGSTDGAPLVICTAHGAVTLPDAADGMGPPAPLGPKAPDCPYCALGCGHCGPTNLLWATGTQDPSPRWTLVVITPAPMGVEAPQEPLRLLTSPPRAPPSLA